MWQGGDIQLEHVGPNPVGRGELEGKRKERENREKKMGEISSTFSLDLATIEPSAFVGVRGKVCPRNEGFA